MGLVTMKSLLRGAAKGGYAVGAFNVFGLENMQGVMRAAAQKNAPVIVQVSPGAAKHIGYRTMAGMTRGCAEEYGACVALHLDHAEDEAVIRECVDAGFSSIMIDASKRPFAENIERTGRVVDYCARYGVTVEAELGKLGGQEETANADTREALFTNPEDVPVFVRATGIDALAIAVGTAHGFYKSEPKIDFARIRRIRELTDAALVLHGGTGVPDADFRRAIDCGIRKINVGTELWLVGYGATMKREAALLPDGGDPRKVMAKVRDACGDIVSHKIDVFGCANQAY